ncbi:MAG TPA: NAD(P)H-dependent oxidoreductase [Candidatus Aphodousia gallistercoris]|nr:NAD(P)H-dependent oxidoreductase [Candidatus Aphodousia gallistercoris]
MSTIFIINAGIKAAGKNGTLNAAMVEIAREVFRELGHSVTLTDLNEEWHLEQELDKLLAADAVLLQTPIWAMGVPWPMKRYIDTVWTHPKVCGTDGRTRSDPKKLYGSGGFLLGKRYMLSTTWNAPSSALNTPGHFFDARGLEEVLLPLHKQFQYMGIAPMPSFAVHDVYKNPTIGEDLQKWRAHLKENFN